MKVSHSYKLFAVTIILLLTILVIVVFKTLHIQDHVTQSEQHRFRSFSLAMELFQSSEDLTRMARSYVSTGNPLYEKRYFDILDIRNGKQPRPANYNATYWHLAGVGHGPAVAQGETIALQELMRREGFTEEEFVLLRKSQANSDHLVIMEKQAFAAMKGLYEDSSGNFTVRRAPNHDYAVHLLYSDAYTKEKARIMSPIEQFMNVLDKRTKAELISFQSKLRQYIFLALALIAITLFVVIIKVFHMFRSVLYPLERLRSKVAEIATGNYAARCDIFSANEIGNLSSNFNDMANFIGADILMRKKAENELRKSENILSATLRSIGDGVITCDTEGNIINLNKAAENLTGWSTDEAKGRPIVEVFHTIHNETRHEAEDLVGRVLRENRVIDMAMQTALITRDGTEYQIADSCAPIHDKADNIIGTVLVFRDISEEYYRREQQERRYTLSYELLGILNSSLALPDMLSAVISAIKSWTGFDAVGIRLQAGDDFPYFARDGFSDDFLLTENTLVERGKDGGLCRNIDGNVTLQCTCGLVLSGKTDPANPLFTPGGSFWTNNSFSLLELPADQDPRLHPRNRCMHEGYGSLALIPIFENQKIVGLLQLNNRKTDSMTLDTINYFELISANIGEALMRKKAEWALKERFKELNCLYGISSLIELPDISSKELLKKTICLLPPAWQFPDITEARITLDGQTFQTEHFRETTWMQAHKIIVNGKPTGQVEVCYLEERPISDEGPFLIEERQLIKAVAERLGRVIERIRAEEQIHLNQTRLMSLLNIMQHRARTTQEFLDHALDEVIKLTQSRIGYIYFYHEDSRQFVLNTWSNDVMNECKIANPQTCYELEKTGIWGEAVRQRKPIIINDFRADHPLKKGYPEGHAPLTNFMTVPVLNEDQIVAVVGIANKVGNYDETDVLQLTLFIDAVWKSINIITAEETLRESGERIRAITNSANEAITMMDNKGNISYWNPAAQRILGYTREEAIGKNLHKLIAPERFRPAHLATFSEFQKTGQGNAIGKTLELAARRKDGHEIDIALSLSAVKIKEEWHSVGIIQDITERKQAQEALSRLSRQNELILNSAAEGILGLDLQGNHSFVNSAAARMLGYEVEELIGRPSHSTWHHTKSDGSPYPREECKILSAPVDGAVHRVSTEVFWRKDGTGFPVEYASTPIYEQGRPTGVVVTFADITERKKTEKQIQHLATHDLLTNLPSMRLARDRLSVALNMARRYKKAGALMFVDLDGFKAVNDTLGHDAGDYVLKQVAQRLLSCVRETDTVARFGGDEFLIIATEINFPENAAQIAEKVVQLVSQPVIFNGQQVFVGTSIGIALFPDHGEDMDQLIKQADKAMYSVKNAGKNGFSFVDT